jgi:kynurenine 3-monooxygenase
MTINKIDNHEKICIIGAGLVGSLMACYLGKEGYKIDLYEKRVDMRSNAIPGGRTIAMSLSDRGWKALEEIGLEEIIRKNTIAKHSRMVHLLDGSKKVQPYGKEGQAIWTINRKYLNSILMDKAEHSFNVNIQFNHECTALDFESGNIEFINLSAGKKVTKKYDKIISADGIFSRVADKMKSLENFYHTVSKLNYGYKEIRIPATKDNEWVFKKNHVHIWSDDNSVFVALPNMDKTFTGSLFFKFNDELLSLGKDAQNELLVSSFKKNYSSIAAIDPQIISDLEQHPVSRIFTVECSPWNYKNKVVLIGDACHAIAPFYAMGMNTGFEDCTFFMDLWRQYNGDLNEVFLNFGQLRKIQTDIISELSLKNFNEIGKSKSEDYQIRWELDRRLWDILGDDWIPLYPMIAFSLKPFSEILESYKAQTMVLSNLVTKIENPDVIADSELVKMLNSINNKIL